MTIILHHQKYYFAALTHFFYTIARKFQTDHTNAIENSVRTDHTKAKGHSTTQLHKFRGNLERRSTLQKAIDWKYGRDRWNISLFAFQLAQFLSQELQSQQQIWSGSTRNGAKNLIMTLHIGGQLD